MIEKYSVKVLYDYTRIIVYYSKAIFHMKSNQKLKNVTRVFQELSPVFIIFFLSLKLLVLENHFYKFSETHTKCTKCSTFFAKYINLEIFKNKDNKDIKYLDLF